jgi:ABC-type sugar transport system ATPase subunit
VSEAKGRISLKGIRKRFGSFEALKGIDLDIKPREFFALLGPSGSGKSTMLRVIAGLEISDEGTMTVDGVDVTYAPPGERNIAMVFQNYALYPHMTVEENIGFPLRMDGVPRAQIPGFVRDAARRVKIDHLLARRPGQLSGGQQQRCALARAIVRKPRLFLLDEPLSNLDAQLRLETRIELKRLHASLDVTTIYVTHDQEEAMTIADRMALFRDGRIVQVGTPDQVFNMPDDMDVAGFIGSPPMNLLPAHVEAGAISIAGHKVAGAERYGTLPNDVVLGVRPSHIRLADEGLPARLLLSENLGESMLLNVDVAGNIIKLRLGEVRHIAPGTTLRLAVDPAHIHLFDPQSRRRIDPDAPIVSSASLSTN